MTKKRIDCSFQSTTQLLMIDSSKQLLSQIFCILFADLIMNAICINYKWLILFQIHKKQTNCYQFCSYRSSGNSIRVSKNRFAAKPRESKRTKNQFIINQHFLIYDCLSPKICINYNYLKSIKVMAHSSLSSLIYVECVQVFGSNRNKLVRLGRAVTISLSHYSNVSFYLSRILSQFKSKIMLKSHR